MNYDLGIMLNNVNYLQIPLLPAPLQLHCCDFNDFTITLYSSYAAVELLRLK